jgi:methionine aminotransferase
VPQLARAEPILRSKLPDVETTIFTVISRRAAETGALNIGQGFPDFPVDPRLLEAVSAAMSEGRNQYAPGDGVPELREVIVDKLRQAHGVVADPGSEVTVTCGGTEALFSAILATVSQGDEVIVFDPAYDSYEPAVRLAGGRCLRLALQAPGFRIDWQQFRAALTARTRLVILNNPQNPSCVAHSRADLDALAEAIRDRDILVLADEVYEHVVFDGARHASVTAHPELRERSFAVFSFGKTLHATGWRVGYCVAPAALSREFRKVHQFNTFTIATPLQHGIARYLAAHPESWRGLADFFQRKRDLLTGALAGSGFAPLPASGTYFQLVDYAALSSEPDLAFCDRLIREAGVAVIPLSPFYEARPRLTLLRLCSAKRDETLLEAARRLQVFAARLRQAAP